MNSVVKSMVIAATAGAITYAVTATSPKQKRKLKRTANRAIRAVSSTIDGISSMI